MASFLGTLSLQVLPLASTLPSSPNPNFKLIHQVLLAGVAAGSVRELGRGLDGGLGWVSPISGTALLAFGTYTGLQTAFGAV